MLAHRRHSVVLHCIRTIFASGFAYARIYRPRQTFRSQQHTAQSTPISSPVVACKAMTYSRQSGHLETLPIVLLYAHLDASFIFNHLDTMNGGPNYSSVTAPRKKSGL